MTTPISKRRRIDSAASTLSKPFRSPFKGPQTGRGTIARREPGTGQAQNQGAAHRARLSAISQKPSCENTWESTSAANLGADIDIISLTKLQRALERQLRELREELDVAEQARKIEIKSKKPEAGGRNDGELLDLIIRWKTASRDAADELFGGVKDRVNRCVSLDHMT
jgi:Swi5-dependent recombination DNA repair protein 1